MLFMAEMAVVVYGMQHFLLLMAFGEQLQSTQLYTAYLQFFGLFDDG